MYVVAYFSGLRFVLLRLVLFGSACCLVVCLMCYCAVSLWFGLGARCLRFVL